jgi:hypothetical protein
VNVEQRAVNAHFCDMHAPVGIAKTAQFHRAKRGLAEIKFGKNIAHRQMRREKSEPCSICLVLHILQLPAKREDENTKNDWQENAERQTECNDAAPVIPFDTLAQGVGCRFSASSSSLA